ncbi:MAG: hypothetical protein EP343_29420 [Deltaproteobacteria bacterium]|nr:MAG: hypothetical protein EP343_29420 [Deltaproteobacteria bacterium]
MPRLNRKRVRIVSLLLACFFLVALPMSHPQAQKKRNVIRIKEAVKIVGKIQKPQAFYVLHRAPLNYQGLKLKANFLKKVIQAVKKSPF